MHTALLAASLATVPLAAGAAPARTLMPAAPVTAMGFDSVTAAVATGDAPGDCDRVRTWNVKTGRVTIFGRRTHCESTSTGRGIAAVSIARGRVLWLHFAGGNVREWSLWTATPTRPTPRRLRFVARDVDGPPPIVVGAGDSSRFGDVLPYAVDATVIALDSTGARRFAWVAPGRVSGLSALGGELAVAHGREVTVLDPGGAVLRTERYAGDLAAVRLTGRGIVVQHGRLLELRGGAAPRTWTLPAGARLSDARGDAAVYVHRGRVHRLRFASGRRDAIRNGVFAQLEGLRLVVASGRTVLAYERFV